MIREEYRMDELGTQIRALILRSIHINPGEEEFIWLNVRHYGWSVLQDALWREDGSETSFLVTVRKREDAEVLLERHHGWNGDVGPLQKRW
jgi:hypothetical protein